VKAKTVKVYKVRKPVEEWIEGTCSIYPEDAKSQLKYVAKGWNRYRWIAAVPSFHC
jgi:hypothetical protein